MRRLLSFTLAFFSVALMAYILSASRTFFLPLVLAIVIGYLIISVVEGLRSPKITKRPLPYSIAYLGTFGIFGVATWAVLNMVRSNISALMVRAPDYQARLEALMVKVYKAFNLGDPPADIWNLIEKIDFVEASSLLLAAGAEVAGYAGMILIYLIFILIEYSFFESKFNALLDSEQSRTDTRALLHKISGQVQSYLRLKTFVSILTGLSSYSVLIAVGVDFADFWAFLIFLLNFIPTIGSIIATIFPCLITVLQFGTFMPLLIVGVCLMAIQFAIGNVLEPRLMGRSLNLSGLVIILSLTFWGRIWGVVGMFLCVPILVILNIILANFKQTRPIAVMLSQTGQLD